MSSSSEIPELERPSFFDGQRLTAADLAAIHEYHRQLRWLHNRSLHNWGIAFGLEVSGARGDHSVQIRPGYAIDCEGHDVILSEEVVMNVPAVAGASSGGPATYYLTASYLSEEDQSPELTRAGVCDTSGAVRYAEEPRVRWQDPADTEADSRYRAGEDLVLAMVKVENCAIAEAVTDAGRQEARPATQPYVAAGKTAAGATPWHLWPDEAAPVGVTTTVATTTAGFRTTPRYQAHVMGSRLVAAGDDPESVDYVVDGYAQVADPTSASFELLVILPSVPGHVRLNPPEKVLTKSIEGMLQNELEWCVVWVGIEG